MKLRENFVKKDSPSKVYDWGDQQIQLKGDYKNEVSSEVKTYKLNKNELEEYIKKLKR